MKPIKGKPVVVRAIHANAGVEAWYRRELDRLIDRMHKQISAEILGVYYESGVAEAPDFAHDAKPRAANPSLFIKRALARWGGLWTRRIDDLSIGLADKFATKNFNVTQTQLKAAFETAGFTVKFKPTPGSVTAYHAVAAENVNLIRSIPAQYLKDVQSHVWQSVMKGADQHTLSKKLNETYGVTKKRAALIARDQNNKAKAVIEQARRVELGITHAIWMHSAGGKVPRRTHVAMDAKPYLIAQGMYDSDEKEYVLPGQLINCRCTSKAVVPAFDNVKEATARARATQRATNLIELARQRAR